MKKLKKVKSQPLICVRDVEKSSVWYQKLLGAKSGHGGDEYERIMSGREIILQIHAWDVHEHAFLGKPKTKTKNAGFALWFHVEDFDNMVTRAKKLRAKVLEKPHENPLAGHREIWLSDLDGYLVVVSGD